MDLLVLPKKHLTNNRILYLTWGSTPHLNGFFGSKTLNQCFANVLSFLKQEFLQLCAIPFLNSCFIPWWLKFYRDLKQIRGQLGEINFNTPEPVAPQIGHHSNRRSFRRMFVVSHNLVVKIITRIGPTTMHCRSFHLGPAATQVSRIGGAREKLGIVYSCDMVEFCSAFTAQFMTYEARQMAHHAAIGAFYFATNERKHHESYCAFINSQA